MLRRLASRMTGAAFSNTAGTQFVHAATGPQRTEVLFAASLSWVSSASASCAWRSATRAMHAFSAPSRSSACKHAPRLVAALERMPGLPHV